MRSKLWIIVTAPIEVIGCAIINAWRGAKVGAENVRHAWKTGQL
jgi:hypothetical protein